MEQEKPESKHDNARLELTEGDTSGFKTTPANTASSDSPKERGVGGEIVRTDCV